MTVRTSEVDLEEPKTYCLSLKRVLHLAVNAILIANESLKELADDTEVDDREILKQE